MQESFTNIKFGTIKFKISANQIVLLSPTAMLNI